MPRKKSATKVAVNAPCTSPKCPTMSVTPTKTDPHQATLSPSAPGSPKQRGSPSQSPPPAQIKKLQEQHLLEVQQYQNQVDTLTAALATMRLSAATSTPERTRTRATPLTTSSTTAPLQTCWRCAQYSELSQVSSLPHSELLANLAQEETEAKTLLRGHFQASLPSDKGATEQLTIAMEELASTREQLTQLQGNMVRTQAEHWATLNSQQAVATAVLAQTREHLMESFAVQLEDERHKYREISRNLMLQAIAQFGPEAQKAPLPAEDNNILVDTGVAALLDQTPPEHPSSPVNGEPPAGVSSKPYHVSFNQLPSVSFNQSPSAVKSLNQLPFASFNSFSAMNSLNNPPSAMNSFNNPGNTSNDEEDVSHVSPWPRPLDCLLEKFKSDLTPIVGSVSPTQKNQRQDNASPKAFVPLSPKSL